MIDLANGRAVPSLREQAARPALVALCVAIVLTLITLPTFQAPASGMDEGTLVVYPDRVLSGDVPGRDFETFYGPANPYVLAGAFELAGARLSTERAVGLAYQLIIVLAVFALTLPWGRLVAVSTSILTGLVSLADGPAAFAYSGSIAFALVGLALSMAARRPTVAASSQRWWLAGAGVASGIAILFRPDFIVAVLLGQLPFLRRLGRARVCAFGVGLLAGVAPLAPYVASVGFEKVWRTAQDLQASQAGRQLPLVPPVSLDTGILLVTTAVAIGGLIAFGFAGLRRQDRTLENRALLAIGLLLAGISPYVMRRADVYHVLTPGSVALGLSPLLGVLVLLRLRQKPPGVGLRSAVACLAAGVLAGSAPFVVRSVGRVILEVVGLTHERSYTVANGDRTYLLDSPNVAADLNAVLPAVDRLLPAAGTLFVGPEDLRRTNYNDTFVYFLLPRLRPSTFFMELNPGTANRRGSGFARDVLSADVLLLTTRFDNWTEPNASRDYGSPAANAIVRRHFCPLAKRGVYAAYVRCRPGTSLG